MLPLRMLLLLLLCVVWRHSHYVHRLDPVNVDCCCCCRLPAWLLFPTHHAGVWTILDTYVPFSGAWQDCWLPEGASTNEISCDRRNGGYVLLGLAMLACSGTLHANASISPLQMLHVPGGTRAVEQRFRESQRAIALEEEEEEEARRSVLQQHGGFEPRDRSKLLLRHTTYDRQSHVP